MKLTKHLKKKIKGKTPPLYLKEFRFLLETRVKSNTHRRSVCLFVALENDILFYRNGNKLTAAATAELAGPSCLFCS